MLIPTPRLLLVAVAGVAPVILAGSHSTALAFALLWLAGSAILALVDGFLAPKASQLEWTREHESKLSLGVWNPVNLLLTNRTRYPLNFRVRDAVPRELLAEGATAEGNVGPMLSWQMEYRVFPLHRGDYRFGPVTARFLGPLGLAWKQRPVDLGDDVKVYPNLRAIRSYDALVRRGHLAEIGLRRSRRWGEGTEFERLRAYTPDDEYRRINWKATAKAHAPIVVDYQAERSQNIVIALDTGRLMTSQLPLAPAQAVDESGIVSAPVALTRLDFSVNAALLLAYIAQEYGDRISLLTFSDRVTRYLAPQSGRRQFLLITDALYNLEAEATATDYLSASNHLATRNRRRSLIILFTDLADPQSTSQLVSTMTLLARRHLPLVVTMQDPEIERLASQAPLDTRRVYERAVARQLLDDRRTILLQLRQHGVLTLDVAANKLTPSVINRYLEVKTRGQL